MRRLPHAAVLLLAACTQNHAELRAAQADLERELLALKDVADTLSDRRRLHEALEERVRAANDGVPVEPLPAIAPLPAMPPKRTLVLPREGLFEGRGGAILRAQIEATQLRIDELRRVLGAVERLDEDTADLKAKLATLMRDAGER